MASTEVLIRRPQSHEHHAVRDLVTAVANETFANLFAPNPVPLKLDEEDWSLCWVAVCDSKIVGVLLTNQEWVSGCFAKTPDMALAGNCSRRGNLRSLRAVTRRAAS